MRLLVRALEFGWQEGAALGRLSFTHSPGKLLVVCGHNGSGKTSLMLTLGGVLRPLAGEVRLGDGAGLPLRQSSFYLGPNLMFSSVLSAYDNAAFLLQSRGISTLSLLPALNKYGVPTTKKLKELSTGQVQRLRLACAAAANLPLLLLDEPGLSLDSAGRAALRELIMRYKGIVIMASNDPQEVGLTERKLSLG